MGKYIDSHKGNGIGIKTFSMQIRSTLDSTSEKKFLMVTLYPSEILKMTKIMTAARFHCIPSTAGRHSRDGAYSPPVPRLNH